jgi:hypothetical protein
MPGDTLTLKQPSLHPSAFILSFVRLPKHGAFGYEL